MKGMIPILHRHGFSYSTIYHPDQAIKLRLFYPLINYLYFYMPWSLVSFRTGCSSRLFMGESKLLAFSHSPSATSFLYSITGVSDTVLLFRESKPLVRSFSCISCY